MIRRIPWWAGGILMAMLLLFTFSIFGGDRPIGASTYVPYFAGILFDLDPEKYGYLKAIHNAGSWEGVMLLGALVGGFFTSVFVTKSFRFSVIPTAFGERIVMRLLDRSSTLLPQSPAWPSSGCSPSTNRETMKRS